MAQHTAKKKVKTPLGSTPGPITDKSFVEFGTVDHSTAVICHYGEGKIETKGGGGTWEEVKRPYLPPLTVWCGPSEAYSHKIPLMLDAFSGIQDEQQYLKSQVEAIEFMAGMYMNPGELKRREPPKLFLNGGGALPHDWVDNKTFEWVIADSPEWGESIRNSQSGWLVRQEVTLTFMLFEGNISEPSKTSGKPSTRKAKTYGKGSSFEHIAKDLWKSTKWAKKLYLLNRRLLQGGFPAAVNQSTPFPSVLQIFLPDHQEEVQWKKETHGS